MTTLAPAPLLPVYPPVPVTFVEGEGSWLVADDGRRYLDFVGGIAVVGLGHRHAAPLAAAHAQLDRLWHASNLFGTDPVGALAERLSVRFGGAQAFFCNSGAEALEAALKYARKATGRRGALALEGSFHGRTMGALALTGQPTKREPFGPLVPGVRFARLNEIESLAAAIDDEVGLVVLEVVQGEGGVRPASQEFVHAAAELAAAVGALLCIDEVQTGVGRTGAFFAHEPYGIRPQLVTLAKALGNGLPVGALLVADEAAGAFAPGDHGSTFGGNPVACAAACAVVDEIDEELLDRVRALEARLLPALASLPGVVEARGAGLLLGIELAGPGRPVLEACLERGLLVSLAGDHVVRLTPPLTVSVGEVEHALAILAEVLA
jgi:predicted acetylornithine/succinylornithine family transaminase